MQKYPINFNVFQKELQPLILQCVNNAITT